MSFFPNIKGEYKRNFQISKLTWFHSGGKAKIFCIPKDIDDLVNLIKETKRISINIIGGGSNMLVRDGGIPGLAIKLGKGFDYIKIKKDHILCGASIKNINLSKKLAKENIRGYEFLSTIPGTLGGAIFMNAGCFGSEIKNLIQSVFVVNRNGKILELTRKMISFKYRYSGIKKNHIIIGAKLKIFSGKSSIINKKIKELIMIRKKTQPIKSLTGGSTFINPKGKKAWKLIKQSGCENFKVGDAEVSYKHCNFLVNKGNASSKDIENLGNKIRNKVYKDTGIKLNWEIKRIGIK